MLNVVLVEDDSFTRQLISHALTLQGFGVTETDNASAAVELVKRVQPHVVVSDLDLGKGASGLDLLRIVHRDFPWIGLVALSAHTASMLVGEGSLPEGTPYLVKSAIQDLGEIGTAIRESISNASEEAKARSADVVLGLGEQEHVVSKGQAETLRLLSQGLNLNVGHEVFYV